MSNGIGNPEHPDRTGKKRSSFLHSRSSSPHSDRSSVASKPGSNTSLEEEEQDASTKKEAKFPQPTESGDVQGLKDDANRPVVASEKPPAEPRPFRQLSDAHKDQVSSEQVLNRLFSIALPDWDPVQHWTSNNRIYTGHDAFTGNQQQFTTFTYTTTNDNNVVQLLNVLRVSVFSPQRRRIMNSRGKKHSGNPVTFHVQVETFERTFEPEDFRVNWLSQGQVALMEKYAWASAEERVKGKKEVIEHVYIFIPGEGPVRQSPVYIDPWNWPRFRKSLMSEGQDYKVFDGGLFEGELAKESEAGEEPLLG